jgi:hypothetical protein
LTGRSSDRSSSPKVIDSLYEPREELIGFRSDTAPDSEESEYEPEEYLPPGPSIYEETKKP